MQKSKIIGQVSSSVQHALNLTIMEDRYIYIGESNIKHMKRKHPEDYARYGSKITLILADPDYIGQNPADDSIEYVKEFRINEEYVKVAIRVTQNGKYFARSLYCLNKRRAENFIARGTLIPVKP